MRCGTTWLAGCAAPSVPRCVRSADDVLAMRELRATGVKADPFVAAVPLERSCRGSGYIELPDDADFADCVGKAFSDELKPAGVHARTQPHVTHAALAFPRAVGRLVATAVRSDGFVGLVE